MYVCVCVYGCVYIHTYTHTHTHTHTHTLICLYTQLNIIDILKQTLKGFSVSEKSETEKPSSVSV